MEYKFKSKEEVIRALPYMYYMDVRFLGKYLNDRDVMISAVMHNPNAYQFASRELKKDETLAILAVSGDGMGFLLRHADKSLRDNDKVVIAAINSDWFALEYASNRIKKDKNIVEYALRKNGRALKYADKSIKKDRRLVLIALRGGYDNGFGIEYVDPSLRKDKLIALTAVSSTGPALGYVDESFKADKDVVTAAVLECYPSFKYADASLRDDIEFINYLAKRLVEKEKNNNINNISYYINELEKYSTEYYSRPKI